MSSSVVVLRAEGMEEKLGYHKSLKIFTQLLCLTFNKHVTNCVSINTQLTLV